MKKILLVVLFIISVSFVNAECNLQVSLLNQDPYPAVPGSYDKIVFQITGVENPQCGDVSFKLLQNYPISLDPGVNDSVNLVSGGYLLDYNTFYLVPYKIKIDNNASDSDYTIKVAYATNSQNPSSQYLTKSFDLAVNNTQTDFDVIVSSYTPSTRELTLDVLNIGKNDAEALTVELPQQNGLNLSGGNEKIIGKLSSNDDTTATFNAAPSTNNLKVNLYYNDATGTRREIDKEISFSSLSFANTTQKSGYSLTFYLLVVTWALVIIVWIYRRYKKNKKKRFDLLRK